MSGERAKSQHAETSHHMNFTMLGFWKTCCSYAWKSYYVHGLIHDPNPRDKQFQEPFTIGVVDHQGSFVRLQGFLGITIVHELPLLVSHSQASHVVIACPFRKRGTTGVGLGGGFHFTETGFKGDWRWQKIRLFITQRPAISQYKKISKQLAPLGTESPCCEAQDFQAFPQIIVSQLFKH